MCDFRTDLVLRQENSLVPGNTASYGNLCVLSKLIFFERKNRYDKEVEKNLVLHYLSEICLRSTVKEGRDKANKNHGTANKNHGTANKIFTY